MTEFRPTYEEMEVRLARAEALIEVLKGSEVDAIVGQEDVAFIRNRLEEEQGRKFQAALERCVIERTTQLRSLAVELTQVEQRERQRLAELLHDQVQQLIAGAKLRLGMIRADFPDPEATENFGEVEDLLQQAIKSSRSLSLELSPPDLFSSGLLTAMDWLARSMEDMHGLRVTLQCEEGVEPDSESMRILIYQSVRELLLNVVKHADATEAQILVTHESPDRIRISVSDNGRGLDPDVKTISNGGNGFGLFSIRERIEVMGGHLVVEDLAGSGLRVNLVVPLQSGDVAEIREALVEPEKSESVRFHEIDDKPRAGSRNKKSIRIMIADDHQLFREGLVTMFESRPDIEVVAEARDGQEAVELAKKCQPDVIIMDISMPRLNGIEATRIIASESPNIRIIGLSMHPDSQRGVEIREAGAEQYLTKDGPLAVLVDTIRGVENGELLQ